jgi:xanthine/CO dehydrogenase XdhC/CoxF family maturation factor
MREIGDIVRMSERRRGEPLALATLVETRSSSYRRAGARMLIASDGGTAGSLSGGCLEDEIVERARGVLRLGVAESFEVDTRLRFGCHGAIRIFIEVARPEFLAELARCFHERETCVVEAENFTQEILPPIRLLLIGSGPDQTALRGFAQILGWSVIEAENAAELAGPFDERTAVIVKTHNFGRDFAALRMLAEFPLGYVGLLGPRKRREQLLGDLLDTGLAAPANLFAPAGLDLGADAPEEIALSIIAEIQTVFAGGSRLSLRDRRAPIHAPRATPALA